MEFINYYSSDTTGKRYVVAPNQIQGTGVWGVWLEKDEEVQWHWSHSNGESWIIGYTIIKNNKGD